MYKFNCGCGTLYVGLSPIMVCPDCGEMSQSNEIYTHSPEAVCHQLGVRYDGEQPQDEVDGPPKLALYVREYEAWDLNKRCFWAGCCGSMGINEKGIGCCSVCSGKVRVYPS